MRSLETSDLKRMLDRNEDLVLINALDAERFEREHIPGSHNVPVDDPDLVGKVEQLAGSRRRQIVVYCSGPTCHASTNAGRKLENAGFTNVMHYSGGMDEWTAAGFDVERGSAAPVM